MPRPYFILPVALLLGACVAPAPDRLLFSNPPAVGDSLEPQPDLVACDTRAAALFAAQTGFRTNQCRLFGQFESGRYRIAVRELASVPEGKVWLLQLSGADDVIWVPLPWHNWA